MTKPTGRPTGVRLTKRQADSVRDNIQASNLVHRLQQHVDGEIELTPTQIRSAEILLNKSLANLQATEVTNINTGPKSVDELSDEELQKAIEGASDKVTAIKRNATKS